ncbi:MAG TPA: hypothetical protein V6D27_00930 [Vampirovibrionales bacterium]
MPEIAALANILCGLAIAGAMAVGTINASNSEREFKGEIDSLREQNAQLQSRVDGLTIGCGLAGGQ